MCDLSDDLAEIGIIVLYELVGLLVPQQRRVVSVVIQEFHQETLAHRVEFVRIGETVDGHEPVVLPTDVVVLFYLILVNGIVRGGKSHIFV